MKKAKHQFHCQSCAAPCDIYKKGKGHRVLVCPNCGVLATNPNVFKKIARGALRSVPVVGDIAAEFIGDSKTLPQPSQARRRDTYTVREMAKDLKVI